MKGCTCDGSPIYCPQCQGLLNRATGGAAHASHLIPMPEKPFMQQVIDIAKLYGWKVFHPFWSTKSTPGYPDLTLAKAGQPVIYAEIKTEKGATTDAQDDWMITLSAATGTETYIWRPHDLDAIAERLGRKT